MPGAFEAGICDDGSGTVAKVSTMVGDIGDVTGVNLENKDHATGGGVPAGNREKR